MTTGSDTLVSVEPLVPVVGRASTTDTEASPRQVWVEIMTTQEVVAVGLRTILENAEGHLSITTKGPLNARLDAEPDVVLFDVIKLHDDDGGELDRAPAADRLLHHRRRPDAQPGARPTSAGQGRGVARHAQHHG